VGKVRHTFDILFRQPNEGRPNTMDCGVDKFLTLLDKSKILEVIVDVCKCKDVVSVTRTKTLLRCAPIRY